MPLRDWQGVSLALRDTDVVGGLYGATMWSGLMIGGLWVSTCSALSVTAWSSPVGGPGAP
jgi:hypothetical protein